MMKQLKGSILNIRLDEYLIHSSLFAFVSPAREKSQVQSLGQHTSPQQEA